LRHFPLASMVSMAKPSCALANSTFSVIKDGTVGLWLEQATHIIAQAAPNKGFKFMFYCFFMVKE
jgi:hypothetical protein